MLPFFLEFTSLAPLVAIFVIFGAYFIILIPEKTSFYRWLNLQASPFCNFELKPLFYNLILKFLLQTRPLQDGTTSEDADFLDQEWAGTRTDFFLIFIRRPRTKTRTATRTSVFEKNVWSRASTSLSSSSSDVQENDVSVLSQKILKNRYPWTSWSPSYFCCEKSSFSFRPAEAWFEEKNSKLNCKIKISIWNYKTAKLEGSTIGRTTISSGIRLIKYTPKMTKMATRGAREVNFKKGNTVHLAIL